MEDEKINVYGVVSKLIGKVDPIGETNEDKRRLENLKTMFEIVDKLTDDIEWVRSHNKDCHEWSRKNASEEAEKYLARLYGWLSDIVAEDHILKELEK